MLKTLLFFCLISIQLIGAPPSNEPIVTAEKYIEYKKKNGHIQEFIAPTIVVICYQQSTLKYLKELLPSIEESESFSNLYLHEGGKIGILAGWGMGSPALSAKMEQLIVLGVKQFLAVGTAGTLLNRHAIGDFIIATKALAEDGVAHLYLQGETYANADNQLFSQWNSFIKEHSHPPFHSAASWSFPAIFRETPADVKRVTDLGYDVVEMEAATLYAIGKIKGVQTLSLFVISDSITLEEWTPHLKEEQVKSNLYKLAKWSIDFCQELIPNIKMDENDCKTL
jgi:purine-nucleoside phosphorylase